MNPVIICTKYRGVFFGYLATRTQDPDPSVTLSRARMAIQFGTTRGVMQLAETGPTTASKISARANLELFGITAIFDVTPEAVKAWEEAP